MKINALMTAAFIVSALHSSVANAQSSGGSGFGTVYGSEACNNDPDFLTDNDIVCTAVFSSTNVWDFLNGLERRITFDELVALNPALVIETYDTVINGITFVRVR